MFVAAIISLSKMNNNKLQLNQTVPNQNVSYHYKFIVNQIIDSRHGFVLIIRDIMSSLHFQMSKTCDHYKQTDINKPSPSVTVS